MIPHPLNLAYCVVLGELIGGALFAVVIAVLGVVSFLATLVLPAGLPATVVGIVMGAVLMLVRPLAVGFFMRWLAEPDWRLAGIWAVVTHALFSFLDGFNPSFIGSGIFGALWTAALSSPGSLLGAWICEKVRRRPFFVLVQPLFLNVMIWEQ